MLLLGSTATNLVWPVSQVFELKLPKLPLGSSIYLTIFQHGRPSSSYFWSWSWGSEHLFPRRFRIDAPTYSFTSIAREHSLWTFSRPFNDANDRQASTPRRGSEKKKKASLVNWPISGRGINLEHGQGQLPRQRAQRCTGLSGGRVGRQGQEKFCGRTVGVVVLVDVMIEILHLSCVRLKRTWKIMWSRRNSRTEVAKSLRTETQKRYVFLKYLCVALREGCPSWGKLEGLHCSSKRLISWKFGQYTIILVGIKHMAREDRLAWHSQRLFFNAYGWDGKRMKD